MDYQKPETWPLFLTVKEVAKILRLSRHKVYDLLRRGEIQHKRIPGIRIPREALLEWLSERREEKHAS